jgi:hypothetical protein
VVEPTNTQGAFKQTLIGYVTEPQMSMIMPMMESVLMEMPLIFIVQKVKNFAIQGRALPFDDNDKVPLGYKTTIVGVLK